MNSSGGVCILAMLLASTGASAQNSCPTVPLSGNTQLTTTSYFYDCHRGMLCRFAIPVARPRRRSIHPNCSTA